MLHSTRDMWQTSSRSEGQAMTMTTTIRYAHGEAELEGFVARPISGAALPCVLVAHMWGGQNDFVREKAALLAAQGYVGFALDVYGVGKRAKDAAEAAALMEPFIKDRELLRARLAAAAQAARGLPGVDPERIAIIGYCFGGLCALELARSGDHVRAAVSIHGMLHTSKPAQAGAVRASVLVLHGHEDPLAPPEDMRALEAELTAADVDWQAHVYGHAAHAFTNPAMSNRAGGMYHEPLADMRSWRATLGFLEERLGVVSRDD